MNMKTRTIAAAISGLSAIVFLLPVMSGCAKKTPEGAVATYIIGTVNLMRQGEDVRAVRFSERLHRGDVIATGKDSFFAFQVGDEAVFKVQANTTLRIDAVWDKGDNRFAIDNGSMISSVKRLRKETTYQVTTKTSVAAVRGTEFSVSYIGGKATVAVSDGKVAVQKVTETGPVNAPEQVVEKGTAAEIDQKTTVITTRPVNQDEEDAFARSARVQVVTNIEGKNEAELEKIEQELKDQLQAPAEEKKEEPKKDKALDQKKDGTPDAALKKDDKKKEEKKKDAEPDSIDSGGSNRAVAMTSKPVFTPGEAITVIYKELPDSRYVWVAIAKKGTDGRAYETFQWTHGNKQGSMSFTNLNLQPGDYEVQVHFSRSNTVNTRFPFKVQ